MGAEVDRGAAPLRATDTRTGNADAAKALLARASWKHPAADPGEVTFRTRYELVDQAALDEYLRAHSERMRAEGISRSGDRFRASRRILHELVDE